MFPSIRVAVAGFCSPVVTFFVFLFWFNIFFFVLQAVDSST